MDFSKTDMQLKHIGEGLAEMEGNNAYVALRISLDNKETFSIVNGEPETIIKGLLSLFKTNDKCFEVFRDAVFRQLKKDIVRKMVDLAKDTCNCETCDITICPIRKTPFKG